MSRRGFLGRIPRLAGGAAAASLLTTGSLSRLLGTRDIEPLLAAERTRRILCKDAWGGTPHGTGLHRHTVRRLTVHHSGVKITDNRDAPGRFRAYQRDHRSLGWPDIAYHVLIDRHGNVYKGRPAWARGDTRTEYDTRGHFLVMCEGNMSEQGVSIRQMSALVDVLAWASIRFDVPPRTIGGHRDYAQTDCPGSALYSDIKDGDLRTKVRRRIQSGGVNVRRLCGEAGRRRVQEIESGTD
jgi:hypothetical protein